MAVFRVHRGLVSGQWRPEVGRDGREKAHSPQVPSFQPGQKDSPRGDELPQCLGAAAGALSRAKPCVRLLLA